MQAGWDLVVIDECLSVQNDTAMQTMEAWRHVVASRCGVLMLRATFFRSRYSKLFYMVRMLRCALPRSEQFLNVTLCEHIMCYIPQGRRTWKPCSAGGSNGRSASGKVLTKAVADNSSMRLVV